MTQICLIVNSMPRDLTEFAFFLAVGFTAGSMGLIWLGYKVYLIISKILVSFGFKPFRSLDWKYWLHRKIKSYPSI